MVFLTNFCVIMLAENVGRGGENRVIEIDP